MGRRVRGCRVRGPLAPWQAGFEGWLLGRGYLPSAVFHRCWLLAAMSLWLERRGLDAWELTEERCGVSEFVIERPTFSTTRCGLWRGWLVAGVRASSVPIPLAIHGQRATPSKAPLFPRRSRARSVFGSVVMTCSLDSPRSGEHEHDASPRRGHDGCGGRVRDARHRG